MGNSSCGHLHFRDKEREAGGARAQEWGSLIAEDSVGVGTKEGMDSHTAVTQHRLGGSEMLQDLPFPCLPFSFQCFLWPHPAGRQMTGSTGNSLQGMVCLERIHQQRNPEHSTNMGFTRRIATKILSIASPLDRVHAVWCVSVNLASLHASAGIGCLFREVVELAISLSPSMTFMF